MTYSLNSIEMLNTSFSKETLREAVLKHCSYFDELHFKITMLLIIAFILLIVFELSYKLENREKYKLIWIIIIDSAYAILGIVIAIMFKIHVLGL